MNEKPTKETLEKIKHILKNHKNLSDDEINHIMETKTSAQLVEIFLTPSNTPD